MEIIKKWSTRGGKYEMILINDEFGYSLKELTNGVVRGSTSFGNSTFEQSIVRIDEILEDNRVYNEINYKEVIL